MSQKEGQVVCKSSWDCGPDNDIYVVTIPSMFNMDGTDFDITFTFETENNNVRLTLGNKLMKDMAQFGLMLAD